MGDAAEGLIDAEARIQERMEEREQSRVRTTRKIKDPERMRALESLRLAKTELDRQLENTTHAVRRAQLTEAIAELDRRMEEVRASLA